MSNGNPFQDRQPRVEDNPRIRTPQREAYAALATFAGNAGSERETGIVLPVGCGKSGCITLAPFAFRSKRTLVVAPGLKITAQLYKDFDPTKSDMFYIKCDVLQCPPYPEPVEIRGTNTNRGDLDESHVVITNIQQLQGEENRWLANLPADYFDLILFDEGHHSVADTYEGLKTKFPDARIINFSATPLRADGQLMAGGCFIPTPSSALFVRGTSNVSRHLCSTRERSNTFAARTARRSKSPLMKCAASENRNPISAGAS